MEDRIEEKTEKNDMEAGVMWGVKCARGTVDFFVYGASIT